MRTVLRVPGFLEQAGPIAIHPYASLPKEIMDLLSEFRGVLGQEGHGGAMYVTEFGWHQQPGGESHFLYAPEAEHEARMKAAVTRMREAEAQLQLRAAYIYTGFDRQEPNPRDWTGYAGLYRADGTPKPAASVLGPTRPLLSAPAEGR